MNSCRLALHFWPTRVRKSIEFVQRPDQFLHEKFDAPVRRLLKAAYDGGGKFGLVELGHFRVLRVTLSRGGKPTPAAAQA